MRRYLQRDPNAPSRLPEGCRDNPREKWGLGAGRDCGLSQLGKENWQPGEDHQQWPSFPASPGLWVPSCHPAFRRVFQKTMVLNSINQILSPNFKSNVKPELTTAPRVQWSRRKKPRKTHREYNMSLCWAMMLCSRIPGWEGRQISCQSLHTMGTHQPWDIRRTHTHSLGKEKPPGHRIWGSSWHQAAVLTIVFFTRHLSLTNFRQG